MCALYRILVNPDYLKRLSATLWSVTERIRTLESQLSNNFANMDWEGPDRMQIEAQIAQMRNQSNAIVMEAEKLARMVTTKSQAFDDTDRQSAAALFPNGQQPATAQPPQRARLNLNTVFKKPTEDAQQPTQPVVAPPKELNLSAPVDLASPPAVQAMPADGGNQPTPDQMQTDGGMQTQQTTPPDQQAAPTDQQATQTVQQAPPPTDQQVPPVDQTPPPVNQQQPMGQQMPPVDQQTIPIDQQNMATAQQTPPADQTAPPAPPMDQQAMPADQQAPLPPTDQQMPAADQAAPPMPPTDQQVAPLPPADPLAGVSPIMTDPGAGAIVGIDMPAMPPVNTTNEPVQSPPDVNTGPDNPALSADQTNK